MATTTGSRDFGRIRKLPSGRWQAFYSDPDGRTTVSRTGKPTPVRHTAPHTFDSRTYAEAWLTDERRLISAGTWTPPAARRAGRAARKLTFGEYAEVWLPARKVRGRPLAPKTRSGYRDLLDRFILPTFGDVALVDITDDQVDRWFELVAPNAPTYRARAYGLLTAILNTAVDRRLIDISPAKVRGGSSTARRHKVKPATLAQVAAIVAEMPERRRLMITLAAWCSLRFGELAELRRRDIDTKSGIIRVRRGMVTVSPVPDPLPPGTKVCGCRTGCIVGPTKTEAGERDVPIPPHILDDVRAHLLAHTAPGADGLLFPSLKGNHLSTSSFYGRATTFHTSGVRKGEVRRTGHGYYEARRVAGRPDLHLHDLRHTGLTNAAVAGATIAELMALAGHTTPAAAMRYQHAAEDRMQALAAKLSALAKLEEK